LKRPGAIEMTDESYSKAGLLARCYCFFLKCVVHCF